MPKLDGIIDFKGNNPKINLPKSWVEKMGVSENNAGIVMWFNGNAITIEHLFENEKKKAPLASEQKIRRFALIWLEMYKHHDIVPMKFFEDGCILGEELADLGFIMDCGKSVRALLPDSVDFFTNNEELKKCIDKLDIQTLGNAIFSQWRYWNHWAMGLEKSDFEWFVIAFTRLVELTA